MVRYGLFDRSNDLNSFQGVPWFLVPHRTKRDKEKLAEAPVECSQKIQLTVCWSTLGGAHPGRRVSEDSWLLRDGCVTKNWATFVQTQPAAFDHVTSSAAAPFRSHGGSQPSRCWHPSCPSTALTSGFNDSLPDPSRFVPVRLGCLPLQQGRPKVR